MNKRILPYAAVMLFTLFAACKKDNYEAPKSSLTGRVVYSNQPLSLRSDGVQLELWQYGYAFFQKIPVFVAQDGTFSATLFDGDYKLVRQRSNGPWADNTDSISVSVRGATTVDVPVDPYFIIKNAMIQKSGTNITATFSLQRVNASKALESVTLNLGPGMLVDELHRSGFASKNAATITDITQPITLSASIPADLANKDYLYARVGVKTNGVFEQVYTQPLKIALK